MKYEVQVLQPKILSNAEISRCLFLVNGGGALVVRLTAAEFLKSTHVCVVRDRNAIVGVGVIKPPRPHYAAGIRQKSGFAFDMGLPELGYVSRDPLHRGNNLSEKIVAALLSRCTAGSLFATTSNEKMKRTLEHFGFVHKGSEWVGRNKKKLSLWLKGSEAEAPRNNHK